MITIKNIEITKPFRYLWLKYINGVNLDVHCANSLLGFYSKKIDKKIGIYSDITLDEFEPKILYLCGVAFPFVWDNNFHLAFREKQGAIIKYSNNGISLEIENAEILPIDKSYIDLNHKKAKFKSYNTCRNWWFANYLFKNIFNN